MLKLGMRLSQAIYFAKKQLLLQVLCSFLSCLLLPFGRNCSHVAPGSPMGSWQWNWEKWVKKDVARRNQTTQVLLFLHCCSQSWHSWSPSPHYEAYQLHSRHILLLLHNASILGIENISSFSYDFVCSTTFKKKKRKYWKASIQAGFNLMQPEDGWCTLLRNRMQNVDIVDCFLREPSLTSPWLQPLQSYINLIGPWVCDCVTVVGWFVCPFLELKKWDIQNLYDI